MRSRTSPLELAHGAHEVEPQPTLRGGGVDLVVQGFEADAASLQVLDSVQHLLHAAPGVSGALR
jgi:hypothetical protein